MTTVEYLVKVEGKTNVLGLDKFLIYKDAERLDEMRTPDTEIRYVYRLGSSTLITKSGVRSDTTIGIPEEYDSVKISDESKEKIADIKDSIEKFLGKPLEEGK